MTTERKGTVDEARLEYQEAADLVNDMFAWKPNTATGLLVMILSRFMKPLEHGSSHGKTLKGEPHHPSWVIAGNLTVFALPSTRYRNRVVLAARLRHHGDINIVEMSRHSGKEAGNGNGNGNGSSRQPEGTRENLEALIAIQRQSRAPIVVVPVASTSHQLTPDAPPVSIASRMSRVGPWRLFRKLTSMFRTARTARVKNCKPLVLSSGLSVTVGTRWISSGTATRFG